jgi:hypothetical protein
VNTTVVGVEREQQDVEEWSLRVVSRDAAGEERTDSVEGVIVLTGAKDDPNWAGLGRMVEPYFHVLGKGSQVEGSKFCMADGYEQIRRLFAILGDRETLDLYGSTARLIR